MFLVPMSRNASEFSRSLERLFDDSFGQFFNENRENSPALRSPALDVSESDTAYTVKLDMPGVPKDAVKIQIDGRRVSVEAEQTREEEKKNGERLLYRERAISRYARSFTLPQEINQSESAARLEHGVLTLTLGKRQSRGGSQLSVN